MYQLCEPILSKRSKQPTGANKVVATSKVKKDLKPVGNQFIVSLKAKAKK